MTEKKPRSRRIVAFSKLSREELLEYCRELYNERGISALSYSELRIVKTLYMNLYRAGLTQKRLIAELRLKQEYADYKLSVPLVRAGGRVVARWTWDRCIEEAAIAKGLFSSLPPAGWFQAHGQQSLVQAVYYLGKTWEMLREELDDFGGSSFVESRSGVRWRSHPEASLSNFLFARGVEHKRGERYPKDYADHAAARYAYYDLHFRSKSGKWIDVEIWGDKPNGHDEYRYKEKRLDKENYHAGRTDFLGIHFKDCYSDNVLTKLLAPHIGIIEPFRFSKHTDRHIESSHWSNADDLLKSCRALAASLPDGKFPTEEWLRKRGKWANREGEPLNTMAVYIRLWIGGVRKVRELLGQSENSTSEWNRKSAIEAYKLFYKEHGMTTAQYRSLIRSGSEDASAEIAKQAANIGAAVSKYVGGTAALNEKLGISIVRKTKWTRDAVIDGYKGVIDQWGISPSQLLSDYRSSKVVLAREYATELQRLIGSTARLFPGGAREVYAVLSFDSPSRPRKKRSRTRT